ncbi:MAG TPA: patatin-like phospholipase family protein [Thermoanaerobaculia bacterium]|jgi:hypothetical protein
MSQDKCEELDFSARTSLPEILPAEYAEIHKRRGVPVGGTTRPKRLTGLSLSGGGIRSATFNLGLLQALRKTGILQKFDYLSTVSGGGYVGGWWSAWLARKERGDIFPPPEQIELQRDPRRTADEDRHSVEGNERAQVKDASLSAGVDPIHHLRLFSNFLTPRLGLLSSDTWRAVAIIGRNLILTWVILLPILLATIMGGQALFAILPQTDEGFRWRPDLDGYVTHHGPVDVRPARNPADLPTRLLAALVIPGIFALGNFVCIALWFLANRRGWLFRDKVVLVLSALGFVILTWFLAVISDADVLLNKYFLYGLGAWFVLLAIILWFWQRKHKATARDFDFWRNRIVAAQTRTLQYGVFATLILLFSAFGYEVIDFLLFNHALQNKVADAILRAGGWGAVIMTLLSAAYTAVKAAPTGGEDANTKPAPPSPLKKLAFALAPPLLLILLGLVLAWIGHRLYTTVYQDAADELWFGIRGALVAGLLFLCFALYEFRPAQKWKSLIVIVLWLIIAVGMYKIPIELIKPRLVLFAAAGAVAVAAGLLVRALISRHVGVVLAAASLGAIACGLLVLFFEQKAQLRFVLEQSHVPQLVIGGILATLVLLVFELFLGKGGNTRSMGLITFGFLMFALLGVAACLGDTTAWSALAMVGLISTILGWVLALGWLADPNSLTIHGFYKSRLVRAYMGASNDRRREAKDADITDAVPGDDVLLVDLKNTDSGAPYHLINAMLNLVGSSDLATQQRFSDSFLFSKHWCGSMRTGFRPTPEYACGTISLGTAVSVSGAAASPEMGALSPSAALAALLTLFNVRTGYWTPTPNQSYWRTASVRLWPVYTLQELVSQTTDLLPFCYLTDGGHFDNSGVYTLVERGCSLIVYADCGADPAATLDDIGNLIRKVRIDFGTEITFDQQEILKLHQKQVHSIEGQIEYSEAHMAAIGLPPEERFATLVVIKPNVIGGEPVDVLQYGWTNGEFPQQSTADQWYDEAQFESYRQLGYISGVRTFEAGAFKKLDSV